MDVRGGVGADVREGVLVESDGEFVVGVVGDGDGQPVEVFAQDLAAGAMGLRESATTTGPHHSMEYYRHAPRVSRTGDPALMRNGAAPGRSRMKGQYR